MFLIAKLTQILKANVTDKSSIKFSKLFAYMQFENDKIKAHKNSNFINNTITYNKIVISI